MKKAANYAKSAHFVSTVTFSLQLHKLHSKVRTSRPSGPDTKPANIIGPWHFGHGGRSILMRPGSAMRDSGMGILSPRLTRTLPIDVGAIPTHP
jgi:hypothetical protein